MKRLRVLLDCDGVLADFVTPCLALLKDATGVTYTPEQVTDWDIMKALSIPKETADAVYGAMKVPGFCAGLPIYPGAQAAVARLSEVADIYVVTSPLGGPYWESERRFWLHKYFGIPGKHVMSGSAKHICAGDVLLDDKTSTLYDWAAHHPRGLAVQWNMPYNRTLWPNASVNDWDTFYGMVVGLSWGARLWRAA